MGQEFLFSMDRVTAFKEGDADGVPKSCIAGQIAELVFEAEAAKRGWMTYRPSGHATAIDVVVGSHKSKLIGIQIKKGSITPTGWLVNFGHMGWKKENGKRIPYRKAYRESDFDVMAVYLQERDSFIFYHYRDMPKAMHSMVNPSNLRYPENNWHVLESEEYAAPL